MEGHTTYFAPAERAPREMLEAASQRAHSDELVMAMLEAMPAWAMLVNRERQIVAANGALLGALGITELDTLLGQRPGEALGCETAGTAPGGCGTGHPCAWCAASAMERALRTHEQAQQECLVLLRDHRGHALDLDVLVSPVLLDRMGLLVVAVRDVSADKRRRVLERVFFHDVMNTATGIQGIARVLEGTDDADTDREFKRLLKQASEDLVLEIAEQRQLMAAENGELMLSVTPVCIGDMLHHVAEFFSSERAEGREVRVNGTVEREVETDPALLRRVLTNMVKNAVEACRPGQVVSLWSEDLGSEVLLAVHNAGAILPRVSAQIFHRSFSTKGIGRGIGTYSIKLFGERYLHGSVAFTSSERGGTTFTLRIPVQWPGEKPAQQ